MPKLIGGRIITVLPENVEDRGSGRIVRFTGRVSDANFAVEPLEGQSYEEAYESFKKSLSSVKITAALYQWDSRAKQNSALFFLMAGRTHQFPNVISGYFSAANDTPWQRVGHQSDRQHL